MFELFGLGATFTFNAEGINQIGNVINELNALHSVMNRTDEQSQRLGQLHAELGNTYQAIGKGMALAGGIITAGVGFGISQASKWQDQMIDASRYMVDSSIEGQRRYNEQIRETAMLLGKSKEEINQATISYMMMGKSEEVAIQLAKNAGYAAVTWGMTSESVADSFRSIKAAFNVNLEDQNMYQRYLDTINEVGNSTAATSANVIEFLADGGAALHNVANVSIEQAMGMASAARFANMSIAEFSTMMTRLGNQYAQDKSTKYFESLGVNVKDANGEMRSFAEVLYDVQQKWNDLDNATKSNFVSSVGGVYADRLSLYMGSGEEYAKGTQIASQDNTGSAEQEFARVTDTFSVAMNKMKVTLSDFGQAFWSTLLPTMTSIVNGVTAIVKAISDFGQKHPLIMGFISKFIALSGVVLLVGGSIFMLTGFIHKIIGLMIGSGANAFTVFSGLIRNMGMAFGGVGMSINAVLPRLLSLSMSMGVLYLAWKYDLFNIRSVVEEFIGKFKKSFSEAQTLLKSDMSLTDFKNKIRDLNNSDSAFDKLTLGITKVMMSFSALGEYMSSGFLSDDMFSKLNELGLMPLISIAIGLGMRFSALWEGIKTGFTSAIDTMSQWVTSVFGPPLQWLHDNVLLPIAKAIFGVDENVQSLSGSVDGIQFVDLDKMFGKVETWETLGKAIGVVAAAFLTLKTVSTVITVIGSVVKSISIIGGAIATVGGWLSGFGSMIVSLFSGIGTAIGSVGGMFSTIGGAIMTVLGVIGTVVTAILGAVGIVVTAPAWVVGAITVAVVAIIVAIVAFRDQIWEFFTVTIPEAFSNAWNAITEFFANLPGMIGYGIGYLAGILYNFFTVTIPEFFTSAWETIQQWGQNVWNFFTVDVPNFFISCGQAIGEFFTVTIPEAFNSAMEAIQQWGQDVLTFLTIDVPNFFIGLPDAFMQFGVDCVNGLINGWNSMVDAIRQTISDFVDGFVQGFKDAVGINSPSTVFADFGVNIVEGLINGISGLVGSAVEAIVDVGNSISTGFQNAVATATEWGSNTVSNINTGISNGMSMIQSTASSIGTSVKTGWDSIVSTATEWGSDVIDKLSSGMDTAKATLSTTVSGIGESMKLSFDSVIEKAKTWGSNLVDGFASGMNSAASKVSTAASGLMSNAKQYIGFNSPSEKGEGRNIVKWGTNMVSGFSDGIYDGQGILEDTMDDVIRNPIEDAISDVSSIPVSGRINTNIGMDNSLNGYLNNIVSLLSDISHGIRSTIGGTSIGSINGTISSNPIEKASEAIQKITENSTSTNSKIMQVNIQNGAIQNRFEIQGENVNRQSIADLLNQIMDEELLPILLSKIEEMQLAYNE